MHVRDLWDSDAPGARLARAALTPAAVLYGLGWEAYLGIYRLGLKRAQEPHRSIICVGNLAVGGSGKTPLVLHLAGLIRGQGREVVMGTSGYGSPHSEAAEVAPPGALDAREWGDESAMIRWLLPGIPLVVGRRRVLAAQLVHERYPNAVLIMDDGFQHLPLRKRISLVLDAEHPKNSLCLPAGPYREPRWNRRRADLTIPGRFNVVPERMRFVAPDRMDAPPPSRFSVLCALGNPRKFLAALSEATGATGEPAVLRSDHDPLTAGNLITDLPSDRPVVVTAKDWVKIQSRQDVGKRQFLIALQGSIIEPASEFIEWINQKLDD